MGRYAYRSCRSADVVLTIVGYQRRGKEVCRPRNISSLHLVVDLTTNTPTLAKHRREKQSLSRPWGSPLDALAGDLGLKQTLSNGWKLEQETLEKVYPVLGNFSLDGIRTSRNCWSWSHAEMVNQS